MNTNESIGLEHDGEMCVVCGKALRPGEALAKMHEKDTKLPICCPLCLDAFHKDRVHYLERLAKRTFLRELRQGSKPPSDPDHR